MTCGVIQIDFCDVGLPMRGEWAIGAFEGTAEIDADGSVVAITMRAANGSVSSWKTYSVPFRRDVLNGDDAVIKCLAGEIEEAYESTIRDKLNDWSVSLAEQDWDRLEAAE